MPNVMAATPNIGGALCSTPQRFLDRDFLIGHAISAIRGRFLMIFALDTLNVSHISTSALVDLLT